MLIEDEIRRIAQDVYNENQQYKKPSLSKEEKMALQRAFALLNDWLLQCNNPTNTYRTCYGVVDIKKLERKLL